MDEGEDDCCVCRIHGCVILSEFPWLELYASPVSCTNCVTDGLWGTSTSIAACGGDF